MAHAKHVLHDGKYISFRRSTPTCYQSTDWPEGTITVSRKKEGRVWEANIQTKKGTHAGSDPVSMESAVRIALRRWGNVDQ